jgi:putative tryptophan/tyrosine transport system substrate-binding protein
MGELLGDPLAVAREMSYPLNRKARVSPELQKTDGVGGNTTMRRVAVAAAVALGLLACTSTFVARSADAQAPGSVARIGILGLGIEPPQPSILMTALHRLGWIEGQNLLVERRYTQSPEQLPLLAAELVNLGVNLISAAGTPAAWAAKNATTTIPIVMAVVTDPVGSGLISGVTRHEANITGVALPLPAKALEFLKEAVPQLSRVAVLQDPANRSHVAIADGIDAAAKILGVRPLQRIDVRTSADLEDAFAAMVKNRSQAFILLPWTLPASDLQRIAEFGLKNRLASMTTVLLSKQYVQAGGLMYYGPDFPEHMQRTAALIDKILRGTKPGDLPVEAPTKYELVINLKSAKTLGLAVPQSLLLRASSFIE